MSTLIKLPFRFDFSSMYSVAQAVVGAGGFPADSEFVFDFQQLAWIDGSGLTVLCNTLEWLYSHGVRVQFVGHARLGSECMRYLDDCGFFVRHLGEPLRSHAAVRSTTLPFTRVAHAEAFGWLETSFTPWMAEVLRVGSRSLGSVRTCLKEIFNNINDHSTKETGFAHVQHYPNKKVVKVTVSDFGRGIPANIRQLEPDHDDASAILRATEPGFTTKSTPRNRGLGLDFLLECVTSNQGVVGIYSAQGSLVAYRDYSGELQRRPSLGNGPYPGTLVEVTLRTDCFVGDEVEEEEELTW